MTNAIWNGKEVSAMEYWKLRLEEVAKNVTKEALFDLMIDLDMDEDIGGCELYGCVHDMI